MECRTLFGLDDNDSTKHRQDKFLQFEEKIAWIMALFLKSVSLQVILDLLDSPSARPAASS